MRTNKLTIPLDVRHSGVLLHPTSLPGPWISGDLSYDAYRFIEFLAAAGQTVWQMLPIGPTHNEQSPYNCVSANAGNPLLISLDWLVDRGWLKRGVWDKSIPSGRWRRTQIQAAWGTFQKSADDISIERFHQFKKAHAHWLDDLALYCAIKRRENLKPWWEWPQPLRDRKEGALDLMRHRLDPVIERLKFEQFLFFQQWRELRQYAHDHGVFLFGDMPIFVSEDSVDVWANRECFHLDKDGRSTVVAGVPPDYFSDTGQLWGNPLYNWDVMQKDNFRWWQQRIEVAIQLYDLIRIDHFRGFEAYWEIPATAKTAISGQWVKAPGAELLKHLCEHFDYLPLIAEDLGIITPEVDALRRQFKLPGMKVLQFAFDNNWSNDHLPHNHERNYVVYTGTHDNDTTRSWYEHLPIDLQQQVTRYLNLETAKPTDIPWALIRAAMASPAQLSIVPMQDLLRLGEGQRMNAPGTINNNWRWRFSWEQVEDNLADDLLSLTRMYGR